LIAKSAGSANGGSASWNERGPEMHRRKLNADAAWSGAYLEPSAEMIMSWVAFWKGVKVEA
jgi:uncharacterized protein (DUF427 family)